MAEVIKMPKMSDTMTEGVIAAWNKKEGDVIQSGDVIAEIETDKATMEFESYWDGTLLYVGVNQGDTVPVDGVLAIIGEKGEDYKALLAGANGGSQAESPVVEAKELSPVTTDAVSVDTSNIKATLVSMPKMSDTMTEGVISSWHKKVGDDVKSGDVIAEIDTDKATMEFESYWDGKLLYIAAEAGSSVAVDGVLAVIGEEGADYQALISAHKTAPSEVEAPKAQESKVVSEAQPVTQAAEEKVSKGTSGRVFISPLAKKLAEEKGINISSVQGSGDSGRIIKRDIENFDSSKVVVAASGETEKTNISLPSIVGEESFEEVNVSQMRKTISRRLGESKFSAPHFYLTMEINMDNAIAARKSMNEVSPVKISFNDIAIKAVAASLRLHPKVNASFLGDKIRYNNHIHIGMAVAVDEGLLVPVIRFADNKPISHIAAETKELAGKAKNKKLQPQEWEGNTFTISNLGMFGIEEFTAIINSPDACILAIGGIKQTAVVKDGQVVPGNVMKVTLSCDHRVVDGAIGSAFLQTLKGLLENPVRILV